jgi:hypothetical protein
MFDVILRAKPALIEYTNRRKKEELKDTLLKVVIGIGNV